MKILYTKTLHKGVVVEIGTYCVSKRKTLETTIWTHNAEKEHYVVDWGTDIFALIRHEPGKMIIYKEEFFQYLSNININFKTN